MSTIAIDGSVVSLRHHAFTDGWRAFILSDSHLALDDERGGPYRQYSQRMAGGYKPAQAHWEQTLARAVAEKVDHLFLLGDMSSFPSEAAVAYLSRTLQDTGIAYSYIAGNHDWHYEGMPGSEIALRDEWCRRRLAPLYQGRQPLMHAETHGGLRVVLIDNSVYEILPAQRDFFRAQAALGQPLILLLHVPMYVPGRSLFFGCGHPQWCAATDPYWQIEGREPWPENGHNACTYEFHREVFATPELLAIFAGHIHKPSLDLHCGKAQIVVPGLAAAGEFMELRLCREPAAGQ
ncbi:MAG: metallophosphoesterase [Lentisphaerae bacterium]|mgnify:CR=1 FL=1|jgi:hypothetical protein|nr:metallophosphoesterase [Lentisphaerota bacterium]